MPEPVLITFVFLGKPTPGIQMLAPLLITFVFIGKPTPGNQMPAPALAGFVFTGKPTPSTHFLRLRWPPGPVALKKNPPEREIEIGTFWSAGECSNHYTTLAKTFSGCRKKTFSKQRLSDSHSRQSQHNRNVSEY